LVGVAVAVLVGAVVFFFLSVVIGSIIKDITMLWCFSVIVMVYYLHLQLTDIIFSGLLLLPFSGFSGVLFAFLAG